MLPSILAKQLEKGISDYIETTFPMTNEPFRGSIRKMLETKDAVYHDPYISVRLPFRVASEMPKCFTAIHPAYLPYVHQQIAFERLTGEDSRSTLIATGTGSGKTECFLYPILEYCYRHRGEKGIKALIIYPMNALASDQAKRIAELIWNSPELRGNVTAGMYVGGFELVPNQVMTADKVITDREIMLSNPPDILMTNYKMLDYLLVRPKDAKLWKDNGPETLKFVAVDEFHTFDGAQGTDLACLLRRLKSRLATPEKHICCIGTSATMGSKENEENILEYAEEVFGEPFDEDAVVTEDRLSPEEFFSGQEITDKTFPTIDQIARLNNLVDQDSEKEYLKEAAVAWTNLHGVDILTPEGRIELGNHLMHHSFMQSMIGLIKGKYYQVSTIIEALKTEYPALGEIKDAEAAVNALLALISHARTGKPEKLRPFLNVQIQLWIRELRRLLAKVSGKEISYALANDLNEQQVKYYLPVVNCRECGATGWTSILDEHRNATLTKLETFYNLFFNADEQVVMMFPHNHEDHPGRTDHGRICPNCLKVQTAERESNLCDSCGTEMIDIIIATPERTRSGSQDIKQYVCPFCGSKRGLSLMGLRSATEISTEISQIFASKFNDDKKLLAFSDNVQDAAHRAGFFNARTWRFGLRSAIQRYVQDGGAGLNFVDFTRGFIKYYHAKWDNETFVSFFIAPNMVWMSAYEEMINRRKFGDDERALTLMKNIEKRISYEIMLEYGLASRIGRTLEKSGCSCLEFPTDVISEVGKVVHERAVNEIGNLDKVGLDAFIQMVAGYLKIMAQNGAFNDDCFSKYLRNDGVAYLLSNSEEKWLPGLQAGRNLPRFIYQLNGIGRKRTTFDSINDKKYVSWILSCSDIIMEDTAGAVCNIIIEELVRSGLVVNIQANDEYSIFAIDKSKVIISDKVSFERCETCGITYAVSENNKALWKDAHCLRKGCSGKLKEDVSVGLDYYGKLFSSGDIVRINAREHTGLLERENREALEYDFKRKKDSSKMWDPNVLSCTPTLEMGIDIGDLSSIVLCSVPPAQAQFLQRTGRAGRKDGNALTLAIASAKPHDSYFYSEPLEMIEGNVVSPKIFLKASAVLERQFVAYCMDTWVKAGATEDSIPKNVSLVLNKLDAHPADAFPFNFLLYVQDNLTQLLSSFIQLFSNYIDEIAKKELKEFVKGVDFKSPMHLQVLEAFNALKKQRDSLSKSIKELNMMIKDLEKKPKDSSYEKEIKELKSEKNALINVVKEINRKDIFNFLSDEGLLPNYAFPESGIILRAVLYRKDDGDEGASKYSKSTYEYRRSASIALTEFAPNNNFYVDGRKLKVDQVDLTSAQFEKWRLCPNCSHAEIEVSGENTATCPRCGSPGWADAGQVRNMLKVQMVYSNMKYADSLISDDSDGRTNTFYCKQLLVDVDEGNDVTCAYQMDNDEFSFGYEFVKKATLRDINFGELTQVGEKLMVSGVEEVRNGFRICKHCGKIQTDQNNNAHTFYCKTRKSPSGEENPYEDCLFLYREFTTEALRILIPATTLDSSKVRTESFTAAFMLGMKEYFGNVDHLRAVVSEVPVTDADYSKQYLVIYDSVPGGTGYLKQLMNQEGSLIDILERALQKLEDCSCKDDPQKDGCYHCLYAYRQSRNIGNISRNTAISILKKILSGKNKLTKIKKLADVPVNTLFDSELERLFISAIPKMGNSSRKVEIEKSIINGKEGYNLKVNDAEWEIEPQVKLDHTQGVKVTCKPDFIIRPKNNDKKLPVAIFTDGYKYHKDNVADDTLKREAIRRSGKYRVWVLSWHDVKSAFSIQSNYATPTLIPEQMPSNIYHPTVGYLKAEKLKPYRMSTLELLMQYLELDNAEYLFQAQAKAYSLSLLVPNATQNNEGFDSWINQIKIINDQVHFVEDEFVYLETLFGTWSPRGTDAHINVYAGVPFNKIKFDPYCPISVCAMLDDRLDSRTNKYEQEWNGFWHFFNVMQFSPGFVALCNTGLDTYRYESLF
ncbi:DEAD/DEAH box helicase [bacterium]|nr:DEAD/DEAH box helicase [bacterium]